MTLWSRLWRHRCIDVIRFPSVPTSVCFDPRRHHLAVGCTDSSTSVYDFSNLTHKPFQVIFNLYPIIMIFIWSSSYRLSTYMTMKYEVSVIILWNRMFCSLLLMITPQLLSTTITKVWLFEYILFYINCFSQRLRHLNYVIITIKSFKVAGIQMEWW